MGFPTTLDSFTTKVDNVTDYMACDVNDLQVAIVAIEAKLGIDSSGVAASIDYKVNNFFITGRALWLYEDTAPTGWTVVAAAADALLAVKGGAQAYNTNGGTQVGTWTQPNHLHSTGDVTLTAAQSGLPDHAHPLNGTSGGGTPPRAMIAGGGITHITSDIGGVTGGAKNASQAHNHGNTGDSATVNTWRPLAQVGIIVRKD
jgi:hypothetical protein